MNQKRAEYIRWHQEFAALDGSISHDTMKLARQMLYSPDCIGFGQGEIRPGKLGRWDMYYTLQDRGCPKSESLLVAGLTAMEVEAEERREDIRDQGYDPDNPEDVAMYETLNRMTQGQLSKLLERLEKKL